MKARGIPWPRVMGQANADGEFRIAARFWRVRLRLDLGSESVRLTVEDGAIRAIESCASDGACDVSVSGDRDSWARLLEAAPLWQDLFGAAGRGDFAIATSDPEAFYAYYRSRPARDGARHRYVRVAVYLLTGEYDWAATPAMSRELAETIPGASYRTMDGLGHFPMSEDPKRFLEYIRPVLDEIARSPAR